MLAVLHSQLIDICMLFIFARLEGTSVFRKAPHLKVGHGHNKSEGLGDNQGGLRSRCSSKLNLLFLVFLCLCCISTIF